MLTRLLIFFVLNFAALGIGGLFTGQGVPSDWYQSLAKAPWTPPGWVFGAAWTTIMLAFSFFMAFLWEKSNSKSNLILLYAVQWVLNVAWNPTFFYAHQVLLGFVLISLLTALVAFFLFRFMPVLRWKSLFILPYFVWLLIASSLNLYKGRSFACASTPRSGQLREFKRAWQGLSCPIRQPEQRRVQGVFVTRPLSATLLAAAVLLLVVVLSPSIKKKREEAFVED